MESIAGPLWEGVLPGVLRQLYVGRASGRLVLERDAVRYGLRFGRGHILNAETSVRQDRMGQLLVARGVLTDPDLRRATGFALRDRKRLGVVLLEHGLLDAQGLADAVAAHVQHVLDRVFAWNEGHYTFQADTEPAPEEGGLTLRLSTGDLILQAAHSVSDPDVVRYNLGDLDRRLALSNDPLLRFQHVSLSPVDGYLLSRVDGTLSARAVISLIPLPEAQVHRSLFGLVCAGVVDFLPALPRRRPAAATETPAAGPAQPSVAPEAALELRAFAQPPAPPPPAAAEKTRPMPALDRRRLEILGCHAASSGRATSSSWACPATRPRRRCARHTARSRDASTRTRTTSPRCPTCATRSSRSSRASAKRTRCSASRACARSTRSSSTAPPRARARRGASPRARRAASSSARARRPAPG